MQAAGREIYAGSKRGTFLAGLPRPVQPLAELPKEELDALVAIQRQAKSALLAEAKRHSQFSLVKSCPGLGPVPTAELLPVVVTLCRFQSKRGASYVCR